MPNTDTTVIANRLRGYMQQNKLNAAQLARLANVKTSFLYDVLRSKSHNPSAVRLSRVADVLNIPLSYLLDDQAATDTKSNHDITVKHFKIPHISTYNTQDETNITDPASEIKISATLLPKVKSADSLYFMAIPEGMTAPPEMQTKDVIICDTGDKEQSSGTYLFKKNRTYIIKRLEAANDRQAQIKTHLSHHAPEEYCLSDKSLIGRVILLSRRM